MRLTWLIENRIAASGVPYEEEVGALRRKGIRAILSLTIRSPFQNGPPDGIRHMHLPVRDMTPPGESDLVRVVEFLRENYEAERASLVHCGAGLGRTGTVLACFLVALGDSIIGLHAQSQVVRQMIEQFESSGAAAVIAFEEVAKEDVIHYGIAKPKNGAGGVFELEDLVEKPEVADAPSNLAVAARYVFSPAIFDYLKRTPPGKGDEIQLTDAVRMLIADGGKVLGVPLPRDQQRFDIGNFQSYFQAFTEFALADPQHGPALRTFARKLLAELPED
jgi:NDP-sugar pyrophosphorylase family protein